MKRLLAVALIGALPFSGWALDTDARYARSSLGFIPPALAKRLAAETESDWKRRVAQDVSVWIGAKTYSTRLLAWSRFRPGFACLAQRIGTPAANAWLSDVIKAHLREQRDVDRFNEATKETEAWPQGPAEDCQAKPVFLHS